ncbi:DegV family EDD domain-containing protein [Granulicatella sp. zg-ZJ]|uniref:DegV family protein n=1 Tax=Granulicatella sp. zg-ZJ TaxID=2678504 RepID=UPI0013D2F6DF|nr:DegV family protein [Granulicatella sp. zg-ZJ]NEW61791.1 DegV family EDD domain-containing protein [Granulicatella sp. zg-ZJ]
MNIAVVTDSVAYLTKDEIEALNIYVLPLSIAFKDKTYMEGEEITPSEFYDLVRGAKELPKSSQPSVGQTMALFEKLSKDYDAVISIHLSSEISGTYQTVASLNGEFDNFTVYAVDSRRACGAQAQLVKEAVRLARENVSPENIIEKLNMMIAAQNAFFLVDDLMHLQKGGRLSTGSAVIGSMLNIKPILTIDGKIVPTEKIRTFKKGISRITELFQDHVNQYDVPFTATIHHANRLDVAQEWKEELEKQFPKVTFNIVEFGAVIGTHLGEKSMGMIFGPTTSEKL